MRCLGVDLGGSGFRLGAFEVETGIPCSGWKNVPHEGCTRPSSIVPRIIDSIEDLGWSGPIGVGFPGAVSKDRILTAPNLGDDWLDFDLKKELNDFHHGHFTMINDCDAVAIAEYNLGSSRNKSGTILTITIGTGIGTTIQNDGDMIPNLEYGRLPHPRMEGPLESHISARSRKEEKLSLQQWAERFQEGLEFLENLTEPDMIVLYGGILEHWDTFSGLISSNVKIEPAQFGAEAGALGSAIAVSKL